MWPRTLAGFLLSLMLAMSVVANIGFLGILPIDIFLFIALVGGVSFWVGVMTYFYCASNMKKPLITVGISLVISALINALMYTGVLS